MQDKSSVGVRTLNKVMTTLLGTWHVFKHASMIIWRTAAPFFIAPMCQFLNPAAHFYCNGAKLSMVSYHLSLVRLSFPTWGAELKGLIKNTCWRRTNPLIVPHAINLYRLAKFFITAVTLPVDPHPQKA